MKIKTLCLLILIGIAGHDVNVAAADWKAGQAVVKITPEIPVPMSGYAGRTKPYEGVAQDIYAKALALEDDQGNRALLVTADLLGFSRDVAAPILESIQERTGLKRAQVLLSASHTHSAPTLRLEERIDPGSTLEAAQSIVAYTKRVQEQIVEVAARAHAQLKPAKLSWGSGVSHFVMNRREFTPRGVILGVNPRGLADRSVPVLRVDAPDGTLRAALFSYACHNTTLTHTNFHLCGDYAGFAQSHLERQHPGVQAMFMMGCGGDANPYPRGTLEMARDHGRTLAEEVSRVLKGSLRPLNGPLNCVFDHAGAPLETFTRAELEAMAEAGPSYQRGNARSMLELLDAGKPLASSYPCPISIWQFGEDLTWVGLSGEVVVDYVPLLEHTVGPLQLWITAYCHEVFGYLPSAQVLREGGYECRGLYTAPGFFAPSAQDVVAAKVRELAEQAGRKMGR